jgi:type I restriction enzyme S subunit
MIADLKPYPTMKHSGVPWLGEVPEHWELCRTKTLLRERVQKGFPDEPLLAATQTKGVVRKEQYENRTVLALKDLHLLKLVRYGDFVISLRSFQGGIEYAHEQGIISPAYTVFYPAQSDAHGFLAWLFKSKPYVENLTLYVTGIRQGQNIDYEKLSRSELPLPPLPEQSAIVRFLDHADRRIRRYIHAKQKLIKLLEEQKQAIIHRAVTRGLNCNVRFKPSGVEWLGDVPVHWEVRTLGQIATSFRTGPFGSILHQSDYVEGGTPLINPTHMNRGRIVEDSRCSVPPTTVGRLSNYLLEKHDLVFSRRGELGRCALVRDREAGWLCGTGSIRVRVSYADIEPEYLIEALQVRWVGEYLSLFSVGATMDSLNTGILKGVPILLPPINEQGQILQQIAHEGRNILLAIFNAEREISLLREYRTRLIADVVTGKFDVRQVAANLPVEPPEPEAPDRAEGLDESPAGEEIEVGEVIDTEEAAEVSE